MSPPDECHHKSPLTSKNPEMLQQMQLRNYHQLNEHSYGKGRFKLVLSIENGDFPYSYVNLPEGKLMNLLCKDHVSISEFVENFDKVDRLPSFPSVENVDVDNLIGKKQQTVRQSTIVGPTWFLKATNT